MIFSMIYMFTEFFRGGTLAPAVLLLFLIVDAALIEALSEWIDSME